MNTSTQQGGTPEVVAVDLFCGAGGLTYGLKQAGIHVVAGIDIDPHSKYAFEENNSPAKFFGWDISQTSSQAVSELFGGAPIKLLAGCAPCQPFSRYTNGQGKHQKWKLLLKFAQYIEEIQPELVTMENVPELATRGADVFDSFREALEQQGYFVDWEVVNAADYGVAQARRRLVLLASRLGPISAPAKLVEKTEDRPTVRQKIGRLPRLESGGQDANDQLHVAARLSDMNLRRIRATPKDGGSRNSWPDELVPACYQRKSGERYGSVYGRMAWSKPAPTMTTLCTGLGNGRFGHPDQDRAITLREASLIQSFPMDYDFWPSWKKLNRSAVARLIGNAVPPGLARVLGTALQDHVAQHSAAKRIHQGEGARQ